MNSQFMMHGQKNIKLLEPLLLLLLLLFIFIITVFLPSPFPPSRNLCDECYILWNQKPVEPREFL